MIAPHAFCLREVCCNHRYRGWQEDKTPLRSAALNGNVQSIEMLLAASADVHAVDGDVMSRELSMTTRRCRA